MEPLRDLYKRHQLPVSVPHRLMTITELARLLGRDRSTLDRWWRHGVDFPQGVLMGRSKMFWADEVLAWAFRPAPPPPGHPEREG